jgi:hypothetical protein
LTPLSDIVYIGDIAYSSRRKAMTVPEALEEILAVSIASYIGGQKRARLKDAIELTTNTLDQFDRRRLGVTPEQLAMLIGWASKAPGKEGVGERS